MPFLFFWYHHHGVFRHLVIATFLHVQKHEVQKQIVQKHSTQGFTSYMVTRWQHRNALRSALSPMFYWYNYNNGIVKLWQSIYYNIKTRRELHVHKLMTVTRTEAFNLEKLVVKYSNCGQSYIMTNAVRLNHYNL